MNAPCLHLCSSCSTGVSNGLANKVTLTPVSRWRLRECYTGGSTSDFIFYPWYVIVVGLCFNWYILDMNEQFCHWEIS